MVVRACTRPLVVEIQLSEFNYSLSIFNKQAVKYLACKSNFLVNISKPIADVHTKESLSSASILMLHTELS